MFFGAIFLGIGLGVFGMSHDVFEQVIRYDEKCLYTLQTGKKCTIELDEIEAQIPGPVYLYYQINNYLQNHRRYVKSRDYEQLMGVWKEVKDLEDCAPVIKVGDLYPNQQTSVSGKKLDASQPAVPCGLTAKSLFNDTFVLKNGGKVVPMSEKNIAWASDI